MKSKIHYPILKRLLLIQITLALLGALIVYTVFHLSSNALIEKEFESEKQNVAIELNKVQDQWRAWAELGLTIPLNQELEASKENLRLKAILLVRAKQLSQNSYDIIIPNLNEQNLILDSFHVVADLQRKDFFHIVEDKKDIILVVCFLVLLFWGIIYFSILYLQKKIHSPIIKLIENMRLNLNSENKKTEDIKASGEMKLFVDQISELQKKTKDMERAATLGLLTAQVSHDLMSPIATLDIILKEFSFNGPEYELLQACLERIKGISESLLLKNKENQIKNAETVVLKEIKRCIELKKLEPIARRSTFNCLFSDTSELLVIRMNPVEFGRIFSNLLNNAIESYEEKNGKINVSIIETSEIWKISIKDEGCGMSEDVLAKIGHFGATFEKKNGSGIGIHHAKMAIHAVGGTFSILSKLNKGTEVLLIFPRKV